MISSEDSAGGSDGEGVKATAGENAVGGREFQRVFTALRSRILDGTYPLGLMLPPQRDLATEFDVSRDTIRKVIGELTREKWVSTRQGRGSEVAKTQRIHSPVARPARGGRITAGPIFDSAFSVENVTVDAFCLTTQTLAGYIGAQLERISAGSIAPQSIRIRLLLPDPELPMPYPRALHNPKDTPRLQQRQRDLADQYTGSIAQTLQDMRRQGGTTTELQVRHVRAVPVFKLYLLSGAQALHGPYEVEERRIQLGREEIEALDVMGFRTPLTHHVKDGASESQGAIFVESHQAWFDSWWEHLGRDAVMPD